MKTKVILLAGILATVAMLSGLAVASKDNSGSDVLLHENVEALTSGESIREFLDCPGGNKQCFSGSVSYGGISVKGTWYLD